MRVFPRPPPRTTRQSRAPGVVGWPPRRPSPGYGVSSSDGSSAARLTSCSRAAAAASARAATRSALKPGCGARRHCPRARSPTAASMSSTSAWSIRRVRTSAPRTGCAAPFASSLGLDGASRASSADIRIDGDLRLQEGAEAAAVTRRPTPRRDSRVSAGDLHHLPRRLDIGLRRLHGSDTEGPRGSRRDRRAVRLRLRRRETRPHRGSAERASAESSRTPARPPLRREGSSRFQRRVAGSPNDRNTHETSHDGLVKPSSARRDHVAAWRSSRSSACGQYGPRSSTGCHVVI